MAFGIWLKRKSRLKYERLSIGAVPDAASSDGSCSRPSNGSSHVLITPSAPPVASKPVAAKVAIRCIQPRASASLHQGIKASLHQCRSTYEVGLLLVIVRNERADFHDPTQAPQHHHDEHMCSIERMPRQVQRRASHLPSAIGVIVVVRGALYREQQDIGSRARGNERRLLTTTDRHARNSSLSLSLASARAALCTYGRMEREVVDGASVCVEHGALDERAARHVELVQRLSYRSRAAVSHRSTPQSLTHALA